MTQARPKPTKIVVWEASAVALLAEVFDNLGVLVVPGAVASIVYNVYDLDGDTPTVAASSGNLVPSAVILNPAVSDPRWPFASNPNFVWKIPGSNFPAGDRTYRVEVVLTDGGGETIALDPLEVETLEIYSLPVET